MTPWQAYPTGAGAYAEINGLRLIAMSDGTWCVQDLAHKRPSLTSPQSGPRVIREMTLETAKRAAEEAAKLMGA